MNMKKKQTYFGDWWIIYIDDWSLLEEENEIIFEYFYVPDEFLTAYWLSRMKCSLNTLNEYIERKEKEFIVLVEMKVEL